MKIVNKALDMLNLILGEQIVENIEYKASVFNVDVEYNGVYLIHNTFTKETIALSAKEYEQFVELNCNSEIVKYFIKHYFFVPKNLNEFKLYNQVVNTIALFDKEKYIDGFNIFTTTKCNARCFYCFEEGINKCDMTDTTAKDVVDYITKVSNGHDITIRWFGGEPLCNVQAIETIANGLKKNNINFTSYITTNGYLFTSENIDKAKNNWNLTYAQITLDGTEQVYNRVKNYIYKNDISPYKTVLNNIENLLKKDIAVHIQINMELYNYENVKVLIEKLAQRFSCFNNFEVYVGILVLKNKCANNLHMEKVYTEYNRINKILAEYNLLREHKVLCQPITKAKCIANNPHYTLILPNGDLAKCDVASDDSIYGSIYSKKIDKNILSIYTEEFINEEKCYTCFNLPNCNRTKKCPNSSDFRCEQFVMNTIKNRLKKRIVLAYEEFLKKS